MRPLEPVTRWFRPARGARTLQAVFVAFSRAFAKLVELGCVRLQSRGVAQRVQNTLCTLFEVLVVFVPLGVVTLLCLICLICLIPLCVIF